MGIERVRWDYVFTETGFKKFCSHISREIKGESRDLRTKFYGEETSRGDILESWGRELVRIKHEFPKLYDFENDLRNKVGPISILKPLGERLDSVDSYYGPNVGVPINPLAISLVQKDLSKMSGLTIKGTSSTLQDMKLSTSSGSPFWIKRNRVVSETIPPIIDGESIKLANGSIYKMMAVLGSRSQEGGPNIEDTKNRIVFMFMFAINFLESQVYQKLIKQAQIYSYVPAWINNDQVDFFMTKMFDTKSVEDKIISTDFKEFDQHFGPALQYAAKELIFNMFQKNDISSWLNNVFPIKYTIPLGIGFDRDKVIMKTGLHGMGSGSGGTNADETLAHKCLQKEAALEANAELNQYSMCLGDDGVLTFPGITKSKVVKSYSKHGLLMNTDKQYEDSKTAIYLRRFYQDDYRIGGICRGVYSTFRAIGRLIAHERPFPVSKVLIALRQLSIIENVKWHPMREEFVQWCMKGDRYRLGLDIPEFFNKIEDHVKGLAEYMPDFIGYNKTQQYQGDPTYGINSWWVVNYLKSIA